ncbi:MAG: GGDEF domain-containing protein [Gaiellaceae bacterium]
MVSFRQARFSPDRSAPASTQVAGPQRGTALAVGYAVVPFLLAVWWSRSHGFAVALAPSELGALVVLTACAGRISILIGPRTWYSPTTGVMILAGLVSGPLAGALAGAATEGLTTDRVWRHRLFGASRSSTEGFAAGLAGLVPGVGIGGDVARVGIAFAGALALAQVARALEIAARELRPAGHALRVGATTDVIEAALSIPIITVFVAARGTSPLVAVLGLATLLLGLALAERAHVIQGRLLEREREVARTDAVTGAPNRLAFEEALAHEHARIIRGGRPAGLFLVDIDHFKQVNDVHGHDVGDRVLAEAVNRLVGGLRGMDVVARWGGDELIVLAPDIDGVPELGEFGERLRSVISDRAFVFGGGCEIGATASVGGTLIDGGTTPELALKRADVAVYRAKEERNASVVEVPATLRFDPRVELGQLVPVRADRR